MADRVERYARVTYAGGFTAMLCTLIAVQPRIIVDKPEPSRVASEDIHRIAREIKQGQQQQQQLHAFELGVVLGEHEEACSYVAEKAPASVDIANTLRERAISAAALLGLSGDQIRCDVNAHALSPLEGLTHSAARYALYGYGLYALDRVTAEVGSIPPALQSVATDVERMTLNLGLNVPPGRATDLKVVYEQLVHVPWVLPEEIARLRSGHSSGGGRTP